MAPSARVSLIAGLLAAGLLAGCGGNDSNRSLVDRLTSGSFSAPEEFDVLPQKPLEVPDDLTTLPRPTPGGPSRVDLTPRADAVRALTGRPTAGTTAASDQRLLAAMARQPDIRALLAAEDAAHREGSHGPLLDRLFGMVGDREIYSGQILDAEAELLRLRAAGLWVPQLPPAQ